MVEFEETPVIQAVTKKPFLVTVISMVIIVEGSIGFLFFTTILLYQIIHPDFLSGWGYENYSGKSLYLLLSIYAIVHLGLIWCALLIQKLKIKGILIFFLCIGLLITIGYLLYSKLSWIGIFAGIMLFLTLLIHVKRFK